MKGSRKTASVSSVQPSPDHASGPEVILDFVFDRGLLHVEVANIGCEPAYEVSMKFNGGFKGLGGSCEMTRLPLLRRIRFLAPGRRIQTLLDHSSAYFSRGEPVLIEARISFHDREGKAYRRSIAHDLSIYRDLTYVIEPGAVGPAVASQRATKQ